MTVLVTGAAGRLGRAVVTGFAERGHVVALDRVALDVADRHAVHEAVRAHRPEVVVNCAAWTDVDGCEVDPDRARRTNAEAVGHLGEAADQIGAHLVHVSTDLVFDGQTDTPYPEDHPTGPLSTYGSTKLAGEEAAGPSATVVRTSWLQPADGPGVTESVLVALSGNDPLPMSNQRWSCPTFLVDLVPVLGFLANERVAGVVHATNAGATSWFQFARYVAVLAGQDPDRIAACSDPGLDGSLPARRPVYTALDNGVLRSLGHPELRDHRDAVAEAVAGAVG